MPYEGPRLACVIPLSILWKEELYLESSQDLEHASYGRLLGKSYNLSQHLQIKWIETNGYGLTVLFYILEDNWWSPSVSSTIGRLPLITRS